MPQRAFAANPAASLPPPYSLVTLREVGDAFAHACTIAGQQGAGTFVRVGRSDIAEFAVVLEPEEPLASARRAFYVGMNALADALAAHAPPEMPILFDWPDAVRIDGVLVGGGCLGWPKRSAENQVPAWLVFASQARLTALRAGDTGLRPLHGALDEVGFEEPDAEEIMASFARYLMAGFHQWSEDGFDPIAERWLRRLDAGFAAGDRALGPEGDLLVGREGRETERRHLRKALAAPSWLDPATGTPWL